jgi:protein involved in temperature-dependent protein secretion
MKPIHALLILALIILAGITGRWDHQDEQLEAAHYCEMVELQAWPPYRNDINCEEIKR